MIRERVLFYSLTFSLRAINLIIIIMEFPIWPLCEMVGVDNTFEASWEVFRDLCSPKKCYDNTFFSCQKTLSINPPFLKNMLDLKYSVKTFHLILVWEDGSMVDEREVRTVSTSFWSTVNGKLKIRILVRPDLTATLVLSMSVNGIIKN